MSLPANYQRILDYMIEGISVRGIAQREGLNDMALRQIIKKLSQDHGVKYTPQAETMPYGLTPETLSLRMFLGDKLFEVQQKMGGRIGATRLTGLNVREQVRAEQRPWSHDWTLSQIERLAHALGTTAKDLLNGRF